MALDPQKLEELEERARAIGGLIGVGCDDFGVGFALVMFEWGDGGWLTYISNGQRADMIRALRECADKIEGGLTAEVGSGGRLPS